MCPSLGVRGERNLLCSNFSLSTQQLFLMVKSLNIAIVYTQHDANVTNRKELNSLGPFGKSSLFSQVTDFRFSFVRYVS
jgi:hypothetical protein